MKFHITFTNYTSGNANNGIVVNVVVNVIIKFRFYTRIMSIHSIPPIRYWFHIEYADAFVVVYY